MPVSAINAMTVPSLGPTLDRPAGSSPLATPSQGIDTLFSDSFSRTGRSTTSVSSVSERRELQKQRKELQELSAYMKRDAFVDQSPLRGFSHAYHNTIESHLRQLDNSEFEDPTVINYFAIDFANRYRRNLEALKAREAGDWSARPDAHWDYAWTRGEQLEYVPFMPDFMLESAQILLGKTAHIDYDLKLALTEALKYKVERDGEAGSDPRSLERDFLAGGEHFYSTTDKTADEMGIPDTLVGIGNAVSDVPGHRLARFEEWVSSYDTPTVSNETNNDSFFDFFW